jgi:hypothetical protein
VLDAGIQLAKNGGDISKINVAELAGAVAGGLVSGAITSGGSAVASICTSVAAKGVMVATGAVAGAAGGAVGQVTQNLADGDPNTKLMDNVGTSIAVGTIAGVAGGTLTKAPSISYKAPSYVASRPQAPSAAAKAAIVSTAKTVGEGVRDTLLTEGTKQIIE